MVYNSSWISSSLPTTAVLTASAASLAALLTFSFTPSLASSAASSAFSVAAGAAWPMVSALASASSAGETYASTLYLPFSLIKLARSSTGLSLASAGKSLMVGKPWISSGTSLAVASTLATITLEAYSGLLK